MNAFRPLLFVTLALAFAPAFSAPSAQVQASRTQGPAPLAVFFDATATTSTADSIDAFRVYGYKFDFGDHNSGTWEHSGLPRNTQIGGPIASHVFTTPGTYLVRLSVIDQNRQTSDATVTITVSSPDESFAGDRTVCISRSSDHAGCPVGAARLSNVSAWPQIQSGKRYLLRSGQDFSPLGALALGQVQDVTVSRFGVGAKPIVGRVQLQVVPFNTSNWLSRVTIAELDALDVYQLGVTRDLLIYRNSLLRGGAVQLTEQVGQHLQSSSLSGWVNPNSIFVVENDIDQRNATIPNASPHGITLHGSRISVIGNRVTRTVQHNIRIWQAHKAFIAHNRTVGRSSDSIRHNLKLNAFGLEPVTESLVSGQPIPNFRTGEVVIANNIMGDPINNQNFLLSAEPMNSSSMHGLEKIIIEENRFSYGSNYVLDIHVVGRRMIARGNVNATDPGPARIGQGPIGALPTNWYGPFHLADSSVRNLFDGEATRPMSPILVD